jgi:hypothetical protein
MELVISHANADKSQYYFREQQFIATVYCALKIKFRPLSIIHTGTACSVGNLRLESAFLEACAQQTVVVLLCYLDCSIQEFWDY